MKKDQLMDEKMFELITIAVKNVIDNTNKVVKDKSYISKYMHWPSISYTSNGMPDIKESVFTSGPDNYMSIYNFKQGTEQFKEIDGVREAINYIMKSERIEKYYSPANTSDNNINKEKIYEIMEISLIIQIQNIVERYLSMFGFDEFSIEDLRKIYIPIERSLLEEKLGIDIMIPILFINFNFDNLKISDSIIIEKMSDVFHLARISQKAYSPSINLSIISAATHALVLKGYTFNNDSFWSSPLDKESAYPLDDINLFFNSVRIISGINTGYAQLLAVPIGWASKYFSYLPVVYGTSIKSYPNYFEDYYWNNVNIPSLSVEDVKEIGHLYISLLGKIENNKIAIANKRLNYCYLHENEEDSIIDVIIALEILLGDGRSSLTHKLALRIAALFKLTDEIHLDSMEVFNTVKRIYDYRSAVVHGSSKLNKKREIRIVENKETYSAVELAIKYLRHVIKILLKYPKYLDPKMIDEELLLKDKREL